MDGKYAIDDNKLLAVPVIHVTGASAGGKWYGPRVIASVNFAASAHYLKVENTEKQKLCFYMLNVEHCDRSPQIEFVNAAN
ncbi:MAG: hypothetical protein KA788_12420 [Lacunisphaera sp.]|nr:hypothetical protein [Lacunisphaera sp.]